MRLAELISRGVRAETGDRVTTREEIRETIRSFILANFLPSEVPETLKDSTLLISSGVMTSLSLLELVTFLEEKFSFTLEPEDIRVGQMDTIDLTVDFVMSRAGKGSALG
jgi:acyl carrier protein